MTHAPKLIGRRSALGGAAAVCAPTARAALPDPAGASPNTLIVAGPSGGQLDRWAELLAERVGRGLPGRMPLGRQNIGGLDGVTGANQFEARGEPDGTTALLVPGAAALSWLVGESRAKFDPGHWVPLWAGAGSAVLVSKAPLSPGRRLRIAAESPVGPELPALLALDLMGIDAQLVGTSSPDAVLLRGSGLGPALNTAAASGLVPVMTFGAAGGGIPDRDPSLPDVPTAFQFTSGRASPAMVAALRAASLAVQLDAGLVLPQLTPAAYVALWRSACAALPSDVELVAEAARRSVRLIPAVAAADCNNQIAGDLEVLLNLRRWLAARYSWRPA